MGETEIIMAIGVPVVTAIVQGIKKLLGIVGMSRDLIGLVMSILLGVAYSVVTGGSVLEGAGIGGVAGSLFKVLRVFKIFKFLT